MKLRIGKLDLDEKTDVVQAFSLARKLRVAWVLGTGHIDELPENSGYILWVPEEQPEGGVWVAVRDDFPTDGVDNDASTLTFYNVHLGGVSMSEGPDGLIEWAVDKKVVPNNNLRTHGAMTVTSHDIAE